MSTRSKIVAYCRKQIGCRYDYAPSGGTEGVSYNCSYLSTCAYKAAGLKIPGWQGHQNADGSQSDWVYRHGHWVTDLAKLKPGDLVFFGESRTRTYHVGISLGGYDMIDSVPNGGVQKRKLYDNFVGGGWPLKNLPKDASPKGFTIFKGNGVVTIRSDSVNVRTAPSTKTGKIVTSNGKPVRYAKGDKVNVDGVVINDGFIWGTYVGATSGERRYVALGPTTIAGE